MSDTAPTAQDFAAVFGQIDTETTRIADYVTSLIDQLDRSRPDALSDSQAAEVLRLAKAELDKLRPIGATLPTPVPNPTPAPEPTPTPAPEPEPVPTPEPEPPTTGSGEPA